MASIQEQLMKIAVMKTKTESGETYAEMLKREVDRLYDCIQAEIDRFYESYEPIVYKRTYRLLGALYAENLVDIRIIGNRIELSLRFHPDLAYHPNFVEDESNVAVLLNYGYHAKKLERYLHRAVPNLTKRKPFFFVENGILNWNKTNKLGIEIDVEAIYEGRSFSPF